MEKRWGVELLQEALKRELENNSISMNLQQNYWYSDTAHNHIEQLNDAGVKSPTTELENLIFTVNTDNPPFCEL